MNDISMSSLSVMLTDELKPKQVVDGLVHGLSDDNRNVINEHGTRMTFKRGQHLFRQGDHHDGIFIIYDGIVRSYYIAPNGREITLAHWAAPNFVGGPELFGGGLYMWSGVAKSDVTVVAVPGHKLRQLAEKIPSLAMNLLDGMVGKAQCYSVVLQMLGTRSITERLASYLLLHASETVDTKKNHAQQLSQAEIATIVGSTRQWVSSTLDRFRKEGWIEIDTSYRVTIKDRRRLEEIAEKD